MKVRKFKFKQILKLHLLKSKMYEQIIKKNNFTFSIDINLFQVLTNFKKVLQIISQFHALEKKILFIGVPKKLELKINKLTNHVAVPTTFNLQNIIFKNFEKESLKKLKNDNKDFQLLFPKLSKKPDLIILFSSDKKENIISDSYFGKIPLIVFDVNRNLKNAWLENSYNVQVNENSSLFMLNKNIFFMSLNFLFKSVKKRTRKQKFIKFFKKSSKPVHQKKRFK